MGYVSLSKRCLVIKECIEVWVANFPPNNNSPPHTHPHHFLFSPTKWTLMIKASKQSCVDLGKNACWPDQTEESIIQAVSVGCKWGLRYSLVCLQLILSLVCKGFGVEDLSKVFCSLYAFLSSASYAFSSSGHLLIGHFKKILIPLL